MSSPTATVSKLGICYDAIVVLGGGIDKHGEIPVTVKRRVDAALSTSCGAVPIIMSGRWSFFSPITEAAAMKAYALSGLGKLAANPDIVILEEDSVDTIGNAYFTKDPCIRAASLE